MKKQSPLLIVLLVALAVALLGGGYLAARAIYKTPLAPPMNLPTATVPAAVNIAEAVDVAATSTTAPAVTSTCGQTGSMTILFLGSDSSVGAPPYGADSVRIIKVDFDARKITVVSFPRNLIVQTNALNNPIYAQTPLGLTFYYAKLAAPGTVIERNAAGARVMAQVMMDNFAVGLTHFVALQMEQVAVMIDTIGGVEIDIPTAITSEHNISFPAGLQTLNGARSTEYVRFLNPGGEAARTARQNNFIKALLAKVTNVSILPLVPTLLSQFKDAIITDLSPEQIVNLVCLAEQMPKENLTFGGIDIPALVTNNFPNIEAVKAYLTQVFGH